MHFSHKTKLFIYDEDIKKMYIICLRSILIANGVVKKYQVENLFCHKPCVGIKKSIKRMERKYLVYKYESVKQNWLSVKFDWFK